MNMGNKKTDMTENITFPQTTPRMMAVIKLLTCMTKRYTFYYQAQYQLFLRVFSTDTDI